MSRPQETGDRYSPLRLLGEGGAGRVWLVEDRLHPGTVLALKELSRSSAEHAERLRREFATLATLNHPNLVRVHDFSISPETGLPRFTMESIDGTEILRAIRSGGADTFLQLAAEALRALQFLHDFDLVHRDLKPGNLLVRKTPVLGCSLVVLDFGLTLHPDDPVSGAGLAAGTLPYIAPELFGGGLAGRRSDLYSLGAVLYEAIHGRLPVPFQPGNLARFIDAVREGRRSRPPVPRGFPEGLGAWLEELLSPDPAGRPASALEALSRLNSVCDAGFPLETPAGRAARLRSGRPAEREREIGRIRSFLAPEDGPRLIWLCGEPGSGKTRVLRWLESEMLLAGWHVVSGSAQLRRLGELRERAAREPTLVLLDEVDSMGSGVAAFLDRVAREAGRPALQVIATVDPGNLRNPILRRLLSDTGAVPSLGRIDLRRLDAAGIRAMAGRAAGGSAVADTLADKLLTLSEGLPITAEALLVEGDWETLERRPAHDHRSAGISDILSPSALSWLEVVAVLGGEAPDELVDDLSGLDADRARRAAAEASFSGLVRREEDRWTIGSRALAGAIVRRIEPARREALHEAAARALSSATDLRVDPWTLFRLWHGAGKNAEAVDRAVEAARLSLREGDPSEAAVRFGSAVKLLSPRDPRRRRYRLEMADALMEAGLYTAAIRSYGAAVMLASDDRQRVRARTRQARALVEAGRFERAHRAAEESLRLAAALGIPEEIARAKTISGIVLGRLGRERSAIPLLTEALEELGPETDPGTQGEIHQALGACRLRLGQPAAADDFRLAVDRFRSAGWKGAELKSRIGLAMLRSREGDPDEAAQLLGEVRESAAEQGNLVILEASLSRLAILAIDQGRLDLAMARAEEAAGLARHLGDRNLALAGCCRLADAKIRCGRPGEAADLLRQSLDSPLDQVEPEIVDYARMLLADARIESAGSEDRETRALLERSLEGCRKRRKRRAWLMALVIDMERRALPGCEDRFEPARMEFDAVAAGDPEPVEGEIRFRAKLAHAAFHLGRSNPDGARSSAMKAVSIARECKAPAFGARAHAVLHDALSRLGRNDEANEAILEGRRLLQEASEKIGDRSVRDDFLNRSAFARLRDSRHQPANGAESRLAAQYEMIRALNSETDPEALLESILEMALRVVRAERGMILLRDRSSDRFSVRLARNLEAETAADAEEFSRSIVAEAGTGRALIAVDAGSDDRFRNLASVSLYKIRSLMCVPLRSRGEIIGTVYVDSRKEGVLFEPDDLRFLEAFADHAAVALVNVRRRTELERENRRLQTVAEDRVRFDNIVGRSRPMQNVFDLIEKVADTELPVLIRGGSGTGKELVARAIHFNGIRRRRIFLTENCAAIPESLLESELFGHVRGAFTGADRDRPGLFEQADGGTLFLDEIGDMSAGMQARLLRVLQEGEIRRVGGEETIGVDVRVLAATHRDLRAEVGAGRFREDLLYRLQVLTIDLPPLKDRPGDVAMLVDHFLQRIAAERGRSRPVLDDEVLELLERHTWPGNVRELENALQRLTVLAGRGPISLAVVESDRGLRRTLLRREESGAVAFSLDQGERTQIRRALDAAGGNRNRAAKLLGISRATLYRKLKRHDLH